MKKTSKILQFFCYDYFEDFLASVTFEKYFDFLAGVVSKIFAIENALQSKHQFLRNAFGKSYLLRHRTITIALNNLNLQIGYANVFTCTFECFCQEVHFTTFFPKVNSLKTYCAYFFSCQLKFARESTHLIVLALRASN